MRWWHLGIGFLAFAGSFAGGVALQKSIKPNTGTQSESADTLHFEVIRLYRTGRYTDAVQLARRVLAIREKALGPDHPDVADSLTILAMLYESQVRYAEAEPLYKRSLAIREKGLVPDHAKVASLLNSLALLYESQGRYAEAEPLA
jgi:tetratricopeptide (TPR) repeat protein